MNASLEEGVAEDGEAEDGDVLCPVGPAGADGNCLMISAGVGIGAAWARRINIICALALALGADFTSP